jgi:hypothetical protein
VSQADKPLPQLLTHKDLRPLPERPFSKGGSCPREGAAHKKSLSRGKGFFCRDDSPYFGREPEGKGQAAVPRLSTGFTARRRRRWKGACPPYSALAGFVLPGLLSSRSPP